MQSLSRNAMITWPAVSLHLDIAWLHIRMFNGSAVELLPPLFRLYHACDITLDSFSTAASPSRRAGEER